MSEVSIRRLSASVTDWPDPDQVPTMLGHVAAGRLENALRSSTLPDGEWCVRRVDLALQLDPERPTSALETDWADQIVLALRQSLKDGSRDVVRYQRGEDALDELLAGLALGQLENDWAWRLVGLVRADDPATDGDPRRLCLRVLGRLPHGVASCVSRLVRRVGPAAAHRLLGATGWAEVAALVSSETGAYADTLTGPDETAASAPAGGSVPQRLARSLCASSYLMAAFQDSGLRVTGATRRHWAVLALAETDPGALRGAGAPALVRAVAELLDRPAAFGLGTPKAGRRPAATVSQSAVDDPAVSKTGHRPPPGIGGAHPRDDDRATTPAADRVGSPATRQEPEVTSATPAVDPANAEDAAAAEGAGGLPSAWGGLLFLLNSAEDAGLPDALERGPLWGRPTAWLLAQLGTRLVPAAEQDPAVLALGGLDPLMAAAQPQADDRTAEALDRCAAGWAAATGARLRESASADWPHSDQELVRRLARRRAVVVREPGWVEIRLRLDDVDVDVRRAGLDLDPGWVWWLGQVVRFDYE